MTRLPRVALACLAVAFGGAFAAGCGSDSKNDNPAPAGLPKAKTEKKDAPSNPKHAENTGTVTMQGNQNTPADITVKVGQQIDWENKDGYAHNVTSTSGEKIESGNFTDKFSYAPKKVGKIVYVCTIHSGQGGTITVTK